jgi:hypothetical protein
VLNVDGALWQYMFAANNTMAIHVVVCSTTCSLQHYMALRVSCHKKWHVCIAIINSLWTTNLKMEYMHAVIRSTMLHTAIRSTAHKIHVHISTHLLTSTPPSSRSITLEEQAWHYWVSELECYTITHKHT